MHFHGNAETVDDSAHLAELLGDAGAAALLTVDFRGYGWSTGTPALSALTADAEAVHDALPQLLAQYGLADGRPVLVYGRSLGSVCAVHIVARACRGGGQVRELAPPAAARRR